MELIQVVLVLFVLFALSRAFLRFRDKEINRKEFAFWFLVWVLALIAIIVPKTITFFAKILGIGRPADLIVYTAIVLLFYLVFRIYVSVDNMDQEITTLTRELAIKRAKKK